LKIMVIDDELPALNELANRIQALIPDGEIHRFSLPREALEHFPELSPDLVFLDIEMPGMKGLELAERMQSVAGNDAEYVFVTAYKHYALDAFDLFAVDYVLKPATTARLRKTLDRFKKIARQGESVTETVSICLFGHVEVVGPGGAITWKTKKIAELFAYFLLQRSVSLDRIIADLFPESTRERGAWYVHTCLYQLRKSLKQVKMDRHVTITYRNQKYELTLNGVETDYQRFLHAESPAERIHLYHKMLCEEFDGHWLIPYQRTITELYSISLIRALQSAREQGDEEMTQYYSGKLAQIQEEDV
jgi:two-component system LytT family response regulator